MESDGWTSNVLAKYDIPSAFNLLQDPPKKRDWKRTVRTAVADEWTKILQEEALEKSSLEFLNVEMCSVKLLHPVWEDLNAIDIDKATVKAQLLIKRYPLATSPTAGANRSEMCPLCKEEPNTCCIDVPSTE